MEPREKRITVRTDCLKPYLMDALLKIEQQQWHSPVPDKYPRVAFRIDPDGAVKLLRLGDSTGRAVVDNSALKMIKGIRFNPPPAQFQNGIDVVVNLLGSGPYIKCMD